MGFPEKVVEKKFLNKLEKEAGQGLGGMEGWELEGAGWVGWGQKKLKKNKNEKAEKVKLKR